MDQAARQEDLANSLSYNVYLDNALFMYILVYMKITQQTQDWGNSTGIRLPKKVLLAAKWKTGQEVAIDVRGRSVVMTPIKTPTKSLPTLKKLLTGVTPENAHREISWGSDHGKEIIDD